MPRVKDQLGNVYQFSSPPRRIVSLVPSLTELLVDLGLEEKLVGLTKFCVHPNGLRDRKTVIGGTKNVRTEEVRKLQPDFILASKEENTRRCVEELRKDIPVYVSDISNLDDLKVAVTDLGKIFQVGAAAEKRIIEIDELSNSLKAKVGKKQSCLYLIWKDPYMAAGTDTFISEMLELTGCENALKQLGEEGERYPRLTVELMNKLAPDHIFLSSEPFPFKEKHAKDLSAKTAAKLRIVDGEAFSWYGTGVLRQGEYLQAFAQDVSSMHR
ncbi:MAG: ABC transporter substrate-binding protein [Cryomorphaceae bacterium]|nr:helical backbone metal receptor [Flavobacteriales bacterium]